MTARKRAFANKETLLRVFSAPGRPDSTLTLLERELSENLIGFLNEHVVATGRRPHELEDDFRDTRIPEDPVFVSEQAEFLLNKVVAQSVHTASPNFVGHMTSALPYFMLPIAKIMTALNQNVVKIETSKAFTPLERQVVGMLHRMVYAKPSAFYQRMTHHRSQSIGVFSSGGTVANITALWVARNQLLAADGRFNGVGECGMAAALRHYKFDDLVLIMSERAHYSFRKAADLLGLGKANIISIPTDRRYKIDLKATQKALEHAKKNRLGVLALIGVAGTTETGTVDPLNELADLAKKYKCHFHVDAAWGGPTLLSKRSKHLLDGIERADSVIIDAHKQLYVPVGAGITLFKDPAALDSIAQSAQYVIRKGSRDIGKHTLEGTRSGISMLVHSALRILGRRGYELLIDQGIDKAAKFADLIGKQDDFELISAPELNLLTYRYVPADLRQKLKKSPPRTKNKINAALNHLTESIQKTQRDVGKTFVSRTTLNPVPYQREAIVVFRVVLANPLTTMQVLQEVLDEQRAIAKKLLPGIRKKI